MLPVNLHSLLQHRTLEGERIEYKAASKQGFWLWR
jgi:hypothetical protein